MYKYIVIYNLLLITFTKGNTIPALKVPDKTIIDNKLSQADKNKTNQIISEGGSIISTIPLTLSNDNHTLLKSLDTLNDLNKEKSVVPRKGVVYNPTEDIIVHEKVYQSLNATEKSFNVTTSPVGLLQPNITVVNDSGGIDSQKLNITKIHKPLILSHEALVKMDELNHLNLVENGPDIKIQSTNVGSHPGMIMPLVITILVVPMFAVLGYMALKKGQEAWKNRHYKRMDFLLDGMYND